MKRITVLLAEDHTVVREGFRKILELEDDFEVVGEAEGGRQAVTFRLWDEEQHRLVGFSQL
jgi:DNA-binding NarL/FixJ family response regulator